MTNEKKIYFTDNSDEDYTAELEDRLWRAELEARKAERRAEELQDRQMRQTAYLRAVRRRRMRIINCAAALASVVITYLWVLASAAGDLPALTAAIPLTVGLSAAFRWGRYYD